MTTLAQNTGDNDLVIENHKLKTVSGVNAYAVIIEQCVRTLLGEIQLDTTLGIPYVETVFTSVSKISSWKANVSNRVRQLSFVKGISQFDCSVNGHVLTYTMKVSTDLGETTVSSSSSL